MIADNRHILHRVLLFLLLLTSFHLGLPTSLQAKHELKSARMERLFDHEEIVVFYLENDYLVNDSPEDTGPFFHNKKVPPKRRYYLPGNNQQFSYNVRIFQLPYNLEPVVPEEENKTGIYQQQHAFLPAYYRFLFRYTLF